MIQNKSGNNFNLINFVEICKKINKNGKTF